MSIFIKTINLLMQLKVTDIVSAVAHLQDLSLPELT